MKVERTMTLDGISVGGDDKIIPKHAKQKDPKINARIKIAGDIKFKPRIKLIKIGNIEIKDPKNIDAQISPNSSVVSFMGLAKTLSKVFCIVSHGITIGPTELAVKRIIMADKPDIT